MSLKSFVSSFPSLLSGHLDIWGLLLCKSSVLSENLMQSWVQSTLGDAEVVTAAVGGGPTPFTSWTCAFWLLVRVQGGSSQQTPRCHLDMSGNRNKAWIQEHDQRPASSWEDFFEQCFCLCVWEKAFRIAHSWGRRWWGGFSLDTVKLWAWGWVGKVQHPFRETRQPSSKQNPAEIYNLIRCVCLLTNSGSA